MADTIIENLITRFGFDFDQKTLDKIDAGIENAVKNLTKMIVAVGAVGAAVFIFTKKIAASNDKLGKFSEEIGVDVEALQELGFAAQINGASVDSMNSSLASLSRLASEAARGVGAGVEAFGILGISVTDAEGRLKNADDLLFDVSDAIAKLGTQAEKLELAGKLGIDSSLLLTIQKGSDEIRRLRKRAQELGFVFSKDDAKAAAKFNDALLEVTSVIKGVASAIGTRLMKQITPMMKAFVDWFIKNKKLIKQNLVVFLDKVTKAFSILLNIGVRVARVILGITRAFGGLENAIKIVGTALLIMNAKALILPLTLAAAVLILALLIEDLKVFAEGGDSAFGKFNVWLDKWEGETKGTRNKFWKEFFADPEKYADKWIETVKNSWRVWWFDGEALLMSVIIRTSRFFEKTWIDSINVVKKQLDLLPSLSDLTFGVLGADDSGKKGPVLGGESLLDRGLPKIPFSTAGVGGASSQTTNNATTDNRTIQITVDGGDPNKILEIFEKVFNDKTTNAKRNLKSQTAY